MRIRFTIAMIFALALLETTTEGAIAADILVPADQPTIQDAIDMAVDGDRVVVAPGTYDENIDFLGKAITVTSESGPDLTVIDGGGLDTVVRFGTGEGRDSVLDGFAVTNGFSTFDGGGIDINSASPTITGNHIIDNRACSGIGISSSFGSPLIKGNTISGNLQSGCSGGIGGAGISIGGDSLAEVIGNTISNNVLTSANGAGLSLFAAGSPIIRDNLISGNSVSGISPAARGGGMSIVNRSDATIVQNVITNNTADEGGGIYWGVPSSGLGPVLVNNTIAQNVARQGAGSEIFARGFDAQTLLVNNLIVGSPGHSAVFCEDGYDFAPPIFSFNNIFGNGGIAYDGICADQTGINDNISDDPLFTDPVAGNFQLQIGSPSIDVGDNTAPDLPALDFTGNTRIFDGDEDGVATVDIGANERLINQPPIADAGPDQTVNSFQAMVTLDGSGSSDPDGEPDGSDLAFEWSVDGFVIATGPTPTVEPFAEFLNTITLKVTDAQGDIDFDTMIVTVQLAPPVADAGPDQTITEFETAVLDGTGSSDPEQATLSFAWTIAGEQIATGAMPIVGPFTAGTHEITLTVTNDTGEMASDIMILNVLPAPPVALDDFASLLKDRTVTVDVLANDEDVFGAGLAIVFVGSPSNGTASLNPDYTVSYTRDKSFKTGCDEIAYTIADGRGLQASATLFVKVGKIATCGPPQPNTPPVANSDTYTMNQGASLTVAQPGVLGNDSDADGDPLTASLESGPAAGVLILNPDGGFTYTPPASLVGDIGFTYRANDGTDDSTIATAVITINPQGADTVHVGDIDGTAAPAEKDKWSASATVEIHGADPSHNPIAQAQVFGTWQGPKGGETSCITDGNGRCSIQALSINPKISSVTFIVDNIVSATGSYVAGDNHDPDGDSSGGNAITIFKP